MSQDHRPTDTLWAILCLAFIALIIPVSRKRMGWKRRLAVVSCLGSGAAIGYGLCRLFCIAYKANPDYFIMYGITICLIFIFLISCKYLVISDD